MQSLRFTILVLALALAGAAAAKPKPKPDLGSVFAYEMFRGVDVVEVECPEELVSPSPIESPAGRLCGVATSSGFVTFKLLWDRRAEIELRDIGFQKSGDWRIEDYDGTAVHVRGYYSHDHDWLIRVVVPDDARTVVVEWVGPEG